MVGIVDDNGRRMSGLEITGYIGAILVGLIMGLTGSGGSILSVPILAYLFGYDEKVATAYSLFIVGMTAVAGSFRVLKEKLVSLNLLLYFGMPAIVGVLLSRRILLPILPDVLFHLGEWSLSRRSFIFGLFAFLMLFAVYTMFRKTPTTVEDWDDKPVKFHPLMVVEGFLIGALMGLVGAGGGFLMVPALMLVGDLPIKKAIGTSMLLVCMNSLSGFFLGDFFHMEIDWEFLMGFVLLSFLGIFIGGRISDYINSDKLKTGFAYFILLMAIFIFLMEFGV